jgi:hypothetical protein
MYLDLHVRFETEAVIMANGVLCGSLCVRLRPWCAPAMRQAIVSDSEIGR